MERRRVNFTHVVPVVWPSAHLRRSALSASSSVVPTTSFARPCLIYNTTVIRPLTPRQRGPVDEDLILLTVGPITDGFAGKCLGAGGQAAAVRSCPVAADDDDDDPGIRRRLDSTRLDCGSFNGCAADRRCAGSRRAGYCGKCRQIETPDCRRRRSMYERRRSPSSAPISQISFSRTTSRLAAWPGRAGMCHIAPPTSRCQKQKAGGVK